MGFSCSDSKSLLGHLSAVRAHDTANHLVRVLAQLDIDIEPLTRIVAYDEEPFESFFTRDPTEERRRYWEAAHAEREAAWQDPPALLQVLDALLDKLRNLPGPVLELARSDDYFRDGIFVQDLMDLREIIRWAKTRKIPLVRLVMC